MKKRKASPDEERREFLRQIGRKGGLAAAEKMPPQKRTIRAYLAGVQGGRPREVDHAKIVKLRESGKTPAEVAGLVGCGIATVYRVLREGID